MPGLPDVTEKEALQGKINSYGETWRFWKTGVHGQPADSLPPGPPHLAWSFNADGEAQPGMVEERDQRMGLSSADARRERADLAPLARPQAGVNVLAGSFPEASGAPAGAADNGDRNLAGVQTVIMRWP